jgi:hypothetical protein
MGLLGVNNLIDIFDEKYSSPFKEEFLKLWEIILSRYESFLVSNDR